MTHVNELIKMRQSMSQDILNHFKEYGIKFIRFNTPFSCLLPLGDMYGNITSMGTYVAKVMWDNGEIEGVIADLDEMNTWNLYDLDTAETAHILDILESGQYKELDPEKDAFNWEESINI